MTLDQQHQIEWDHNVVIDADALMCNHGDVDDDYGWVPIPLDWLQSVGL